MRAKTQAPNVAWRDLAGLAPGEVAWELTRPLPWLLASWYLAGAGWYPAAAVASFFFFLAGLRLAHDAFHYNLSLPRAVTEFVIWAISAVMLGSMHAVQIHHLRHHVHCLEDEDLEGSSARMSAWSALLYGPRFTFALHRYAWRLAGRRQRKWVVLELGLTVAAATAVLLGPGWWAYHVMAMAAGHCLTAFFAVWTVHHDCEGDPMPARTLRNRWKSLLSHEMFFHVEHHLFPGVPTRKLAALASRLDAAWPEASRRQVW